MRSLFRRIARIVLSASKIISRKGLYHFLRKQSEGISEGEKVLSVGSGGGINERLLKDANRRGFEVTQLDIDVDRHPDIVADLCTWSDPNAYDVVILSEVVEHLHAPKAAARNVFDSMRPGGKLILTTSWLASLLDAMLQHKRRSSKADGAHAHAVCEAASACRS